MIIPSFVTRRSIVWTQRANTDFFLCTSGQGNSGVGISVVYPSLWVDQTAASGGTGNLFVCNGGANGGASYGGGTGNSMGLYYASTPSMLGTQYSQATLQDVPTVDKRIGVAVRVQSGASNSAYGLWYDVHSGTLNLVKITGILSTAFTSITSTSKTYVATNKLRLEAIGSGSATKLYAYEDTGSGFVAVFSNVDPGGSYISGGQPGISGSAFSGSGNGGVLDDWSGGDGV